jgi:Cof subfamily protein (haloacid dehalogenase superfamily)
VTPIPVAVPDGVRLIGSDLDGTLLNARMDVGERTRAALPRAVSAGVGFAYVTGRPPRWLRPVTDQTGVAGMAVCANGALVVDLARRSLVRATTIDPDLADAVITSLRKAVPGIAFAVERVDHGAAAAHDLARMSVFGMEAEYSPVWGHPPEAEVADARDLVRRGELIKVLAIPPAGSGHDNDSLVDLTLGHVAGALNVTHSGARLGLVEIMSARADKGMAFLEVAETLGVDPGDTVAVGDMPNDIPLLRAAGTGYAVANAHPATRAIAAHVLPSNEEDGVGHLLEAVLATRPDPARPSAR